MTKARDDPASPLRPERRPELDALRTLVVLGLVFFHAGLVFDANDDFYVKNAETTEATTILAGFAVVWAMPMLFLVAGLGSWHSLRRRGPTGFASERLRRLGVPLMFATVTMIPLPQWLRLRAAPGYDESYLEFLPRFFTVRLDLSDFPFVLRGEYFETGHLWFIVLLLTFSLLLAVVARWVPRDRARQVEESLAAGTRWRGTVLLPAIPLGVISALAGMEEDFAGWSRWAYLLFFGYGFLLATDPRFRQAIRRDAAQAAALGVVLFGIGMPGFLIAGGDPFTDMTPSALGVRTLYGATGWVWLVAILGLLDRRPARTARHGATSGRGRQLSAYLAAAVLPIYILHQPIVVAVAYGVVGWDVPIAVKYTAIVAASLVLTITAYDLLVRRTPVTRFLFGMRRQVAQAGREARR